MKRSPRMKQNQKSLALVLTVCLLTCAAIFPASADGDDRNMFFAGYRWLLPYSALFSSPDLSDCTGMTAEQGLVWAVSREDECLLVIYADQNGAGQEAYVEESRTSRADRADISQWLKDTGKQQVTVKEQDIAPLFVRQLADGQAGMFAQPEDQTVPAGEEAVFAVSAPEGASCQWQYSKDSGETWGDLRNAEFWTGCRKDTLRFRAEEKYSGFLFRCVISGKNYRMESLPARLTVPGKVVPFDEKPADSAAAPGEQVTFHASLRDAEKYHWQYSKDGGATWGDLTNGAFWQGNKTDTLTFTADLKHSGLLFRCAALIKGETVCSDPAKLTVEEQADVLPSIHAQTGDLIVREGDEVTISVEAENARTYEWQYSKDKGKTWKQFRNSKIWEGSEAATLTFKATLSQDLMLIRCAVSSGAGTVTSKPLRLSVLFK